MALPSFMLVRAHLIVQCPAAPAQFLGPHSIGGEHGVQRGVQRLVVAIDEA